MSRISAPSAPTSSWLRPPAGSSSSSSFGSAASARASSTRFCVPKGKAATGVSAHRVEAEQCDQLARRSVGRALARRATRGRRSALAKNPLDGAAVAPTMTLSSTLMVRNSARFWNVRPMPSAAMRWRGMLQQRWPSNEIEPPSHS